MTPDPQPTFFFAGGSTSPKPKDSGDGDAASPLFAFTPAQIAVLRSIFAAEQCPTKKPHRQSGKKGGTKVCFNCGDTMTPAALHDHRRTCTRAKGVNCRRCGGSDHHERACAAFHDIRKGQGKFRVEAKSKPRAADASSVDSRATSAPPAADSAFFAADSSPESTQSESLSETPAEEFFDFQSNLVGVVAEVAASSSSQPLRLRQPTHLASSWTAAPGIITPALRRSCRMPERSPSRISFRRRQLTGKAILRKSGRIFIFDSALRKAASFLLPFREFEFRPSGQSAASSSNRSA